MLGERYKKLLRDIRVQLWLPYSLFMCFFCPFSILINLLGVEGAGLCVLSCICLLVTHTLNCVTFSFPPGVRGWLRLLLVAFLDFSVYLFIIGQLLFKV